PAVAGVVIAVSSAAWAVLFNALSYVIIIFTWRYIHLPPRPAQTEARKSLLRDMRDGFAYIQARPALFTMFLLLTVVALFARPLSYMLSAFVGAVFEGGPQTLALFTASVGAGAIVAGMK